MIKEYMVKTFQLWIYHNQIYKVNANISHDQLTYMIDGQIGNRTVAVSISKNAQTR